MEEEAKRKKGDVVKFYTYGGKFKIGEGIITKVLFDVEMGEFYTIKPKIRFTNGNTITRTNNEIKALN